MSLITIFICGEDYIVGTVFSNQSSSF